MAMNSQFAGHFWIKEIVKIGDLRRMSEALEQVLTELAETRGLRATHSIRNTTVVSLLGSPSQKLDNP